MAAIYLRYDIDMTS